MKRGMSRALERVPLQVGEAMLSFDKLRERVAGLHGKEKERAVATLHCYYSRGQLVEMLGIKPSYVNCAVRRNRDILEAASIGRNMMISDMAEHKVIELLQKMDVDQIAHDKKPQAVKYLVDSIAITKGLIRKPSDGDQETVTELIYRVRSRMKPPDKVTKAIDVTGEVEDELPAMVRDAEKDGASI